MGNRPEDGYAVLRFDFYDDLSAASIREDPGVHVTVKEILPTLEEAQREVERLTALNEGKDCVYFFQFTRVFPDGRHVRVDY